ncbi:hypothetical protein J2W44_005564 [Priestia aryabhattai]|uniref:hypothetical protein n=1 Tax=Priestia aryabhattai TaxID=412384 RepID=UPI0027E4A2FB|nr:hypothetical protein [Priestia aryabhattai]MDP9726452.1 hypothetical protein [Priestia aryabhattai]
MMSVTFYIADSKEEVNDAEYGVYLEDEVHDYLWEKAKGNRYEFELLLNLDPYDHKQFNVHEVKRLNRICEIILSEYKEPFLIEFVQELHSLCIKALDKNKLIFALGD